MNNGPIVVLRNSIKEDVPRIAELLKISRPGLEQEYPLDALSGPMHHYPQGQFVVEYDGNIVGYCATFRIGKDLALKPHTWDEITGYGFASQHDPFGEYLYCMDLCVHPDYQGLKIENRLLFARKRLCQAEGLTGMVMAGRMPNYHRFRKKFPTPREYINAVKSKEILEPELSIHLQNHFQILDILEDYSPVDEHSCGHAVHLVWYNPDKMETETNNNQQLPYFSQMQTVRISLVQYLQRKIDSFDEFERIVEYFVKAVSDQNSDFILFPELFTMQLLSIHKQNLSHEHCLLTLTDYTHTIQKLMQNMAIKYDINIIAGSHPSRENERVHNVSSIFLRDGQIHQQYKLHPSANERYCWGISGGEKLSVIKTQNGPIAVLICYDCEFPELARLAVEEGARIIFVPFSTHERHSYMRLRYCAQARAVENQCYVVTAGNVGNLPGVPGMDVQYAQSSIFTPCDYSLSRDGIAVDTPINVEMVAYADLNMHDLEAARCHGSALHLQDRRDDLYNLSWREKKEK